MLWASFMHLPFLLPVTAIVWLQMFMLNWAKFSHLLSSWNEFWGAEVAWVLYMSQKAQFYAHRICNTAFKNVLEILYDGFPKDFRFFKLFHLNRFCASGLITVDLLLVLMTEAWNSPSKAIILTGVGGMKICSRGEQSVWIKCFTEKVACCISYAF